MDPYEKAERKRQARHRLHAQKARAGRLRNRAIAISLICFALLWGAVFVQMATGNDPVLGATSVKTASAAKPGRTESAATAAASEPEVETDEGTVEAEAEGEGEADFEAELQAELEAEFAQAEAETEAIEFEAASEEPEPVTSSQS